MPLPIPHTIGNELLIITGETTLSNAVKSLKMRLIEGAIRFLNGLREIDGIEIQAKGELEPFILDFVVGHYDYDRDVGDCVRFTDVDRQRRTWVTREFRAADQGAQFPLRAYRFRILTKPTRVLHMGKWYTLEPGQTQKSFHDLPPFKVAMNHRKVRVPVTGTLREQYRWLVRKYHPDLKITPDEIEKANDMLKYINVAYQSGDVQTIRKLAVDEVVRFDGPVFEGAKEVVYEVFKLGVALSFYPPSTILDERYWAWMLDEIRRMTRKTYADLDKVQKVVKVKPYDRALPDIH